MRTVRPTMLLLALLLVSAAPLAPPDDTIRAANEAFERGDLAAAVRLYAVAEERAADPGLVAFNRAALLFRQGAFRDAELEYDRVLDDQACPPDRAAKAWFNRGTSLLRRGDGEAVYRSAIACFERCLESDAADEPLRGDARHNLELAKLLWVDANRKAAKQATPNTPTPVDERQAPPPSKTAKKDKAPGDPGTDTGKDGPKNPRATPQPTPAPVPKGVTPKETAAQAAGNNPTLPLLHDDAAPQSLSPQDTREYLNRTADRLRREQQGMLRMLYGPDRPGVMDW